MAKTRKDVVKDKLGAAHLTLAEHRRMILEAAQRHAENVDATYQAAGEETRT